MIIGTAVDELIRHHPSLKHSVFEALKSTLSHLENVGMSYTSSDDIKRWYQLISVSQVRTPSADITMQEPTSSSQQGHETHLADDEGPGQLDDQDDSEEKSHANLIVNYIDVLGRVRVTWLLEKLGLICLCLFSSLTAFSSILFIAETSYSTRTALRESEGSPRCLVYLTTSRTMLLRIPWCKCYAPWPR